MPNQQPPERTGTPPHEGGGEQAVAELDEVYELQDHEFSLEVDDTLEFPNGSAPPAPLPPWAAASRALLDSWLEPFAGDPLRTVEVALGPLPNLSRVDPESENVRERLAFVTRQMHAREIYYQELERALVVARGRLRGQSFRMAELELELREARQRLDELVAKSDAPAPTPLSDESLDITVSELSASDHAVVEEAVAQAYAFEPLDPSVPQPEESAHGDVPFDLTQAPNDDDAHTLTEITADDATSYELETGVRARPKPRSSARKRSPQQRPARTAARNVTKPRRTTGRGGEPIAELCQIQGIGPRIAERLQKCGISLDALAAASSGELDRIAERIGVTGDRIKREGWSKQARALRRPQRQGKKPG